MNLKYLFSIFFTLFLFSAHSFATKIYNVTIKLNKAIDFSYLKIYVDNGQSQKQIEIKDTKNLNILLKGEYYAQYAMIKLTYPKQSSLVNYFENRFFVTQKPAVIILNVGEVDKSPFEDYKLINAVDLKIEKESMNEYVSTEQNMVKSFLLQHDKEVYYGTDTSSQKEYFRLNRKVEEKCFDYVQKNGSSYYAFVYFRRNLLNLIPPDSTLIIFDQIFPSKFKDSEEGNFIKRYLKGKLAVKLNNFAPDFIARDINGRTISLSSFRNKKYVLITFWATWCGPCIAEIPKIKSIYEKYPNDLEIISIAYSSNETAYLKAVKDNKMNWVNIYDNTKLINDYGGLKNIPRNYLIDMTGKIIYDNSVEENGDVGLINLGSKLNDLLHK